jgi:hypothetical protein
VNARLAALRTWGTGSVWVAGSEPEPAPVQATVVHVVHHYLPAAGSQELPLERDAIEATEVRRIGAGRERLWSRGVR